MSKRFTCTRCKGELSAPPAYKVSTYSEPVCLWCAAELAKGSKR